MFNIQKRVRLVVIDRKVKFMGGFSVKTDHESVIDIHSCYSLLLRFISLRL